MYCSTWFKNKIWNGKYINLGLYFIIIAVYYSDPDVFYFTLTSLSLSLWQNIMLLILREGLLITNITSSWEEVSTDVHNLTGDFKHFFRRSWPLSGKSLTSETRKNEWTLFSALGNRNVYRAVGLTNMWTAPSHRYPSRWYQNWLSAAVWITKFLWFWTRHRSPEEVYIKSIFPCGRLKCRDGACRRQHMHVSAAPGASVCCHGVFLCAFTCCWTPLADSHPPVAGYPLHTHTDVYITVACDRTPASRLNKLYLLSF